MASASFTIPAGSLPPDFDPSKPLKVRSGRAVMPAFDRSKYGGLEAPPKDPDDPDAGGGGAVPPNPDGGGGSGALGGTGTVTERLNAIENAINFASIDAVCNEDGTITVTLNWGSAPPP